MIITVRVMIEKALKKYGANGLVNPDESCGCDMEELAPCQAISEFCELAKSRVLGPGEYLGECGPGDVYFEPIGGQTGIGDKKDGTGRV